MNHTARLDDADGIALYIHWPYCVSKCPYCDFNSHAAETIDQARWRRALLAEIDRVAAPIAGRRLVSIYFGGGTPSLMAPETAGALIDRAKRWWPAAIDLETTLEANPSSAERARFADFRDAGVDRLSLGVQSLDDGALRFLGRAHDAAQARAALAAAAAIFPRFSFDLIYARPGQGLAAWRAELADALALAGDHLSLYQLTIEPGTAFARQGVGGADEEEAAEMFEWTRHHLAAAGLPAYEISNHARPGAESRHNLVYWRGGDFVGIGPGAHGRLTRDGRVLATRAIPRPDGWLAAVEGRGDGTLETASLDPGERIEELLMMGLRLTEGIGRQRFARLAGRRLEDALEPDRVAGLVEEGFLAWTPDALRATEAGLQRLNAVLSYLLGA